MQGTNLAGVPIWTRGARRFKAHRPHARPMNMPRVAGPAPSRRYERRRTVKKPLHKVMSEHLESWLPWRDQAERPVPDSSARKWLRRCH
jgi:hypothetical protein